MRNPTIVLLSMCVALAAQAGRERPFLDEPRPMSQTAPEWIEEQAWQEAEVKLPPYPKDEALVEFQVDRPNDRFRYFLDRDAISVDGGDGVVRYTVVMESDRGARNLAHEGIRCETLEYKIYAYGGKDGQFQPVRHPQWKAIRADSYNRFRRDLYDFYFCDNLLPRQSEQIQRALQRGGEGKGNPFFGG